MLLILNAETILSFSYINDTFRQSTNIYCVYYIEYIVEQHYVKISHSKFCWYKTTNEIPMNMIKSFWILPSLKAEFLIQDVIILLPVNVPVTNIILICNMYIV